MQKKTVSWLGVYLTLAVAAVAVALAGCGGGKVNAISTGSGGGGGTNVVCTVTGATCSSDSQCCSHACDPVSATCKSSVSTCSGPGSSCAVKTDCCNLQCDTSRGVCASGACVADGDKCTSSDQCCGGNCSGGTCQALNASCKTAGNPCTDNSGCCSGLCAGGTCALGSSFCIQPGDACARDTDCCGGLCMIASGATLGTCQDVQTTGTGSCTHDGVLCNGCGSCCSKNCGPWALTGVNVCQPGLGCKILNSLCTSDAECCGGSGTSPVVTCIPATDPTGAAVSIGVCAQNHGNQVPGGICKLTGGTNACSNAESDCDCAVSPKAACCAYDTLGLPRCLGSGACGDGSTGVFSGVDSKCCRAAGQSCNTAAECCGLAPCVPDSTGALHCLGGKPDGGIACVESGGTCTATGDCCTGLVCNITPGAGSGKCGQPPTPPPTDAGVCALYGQACNANTPCCNNVQCTYSPTNTACQPGNVGCTCYNPIQIGFQGAP